MKKCYKITYEIVSLNNSTFTATFICAGPASAIDLLRKTMLKKDKFEILKLELVDRTVYVD